MRTARSFQVRDPGGARSRRHRVGRAPRSTTLLELVHSISAVTSDDREVVATVLHLLRTRQVRLCGILRDTPVDDLS